MRYPNRWTVGEWTFYEVEDHGFPAFEGRSVFAYAVGKVETPAGKPKLGEFHASLDRAIIAAIGEKYTGPRGAGGQGVGTAADWFARMIGMDALVAVDYQAGQKLVTTILAETAKHDGPLYVRARAVTSGLEAAGVTLAAQVHP